jgi:hypothetical protein
MAETCHQASGQYGGVQSDSVILHGWLLAGKKVEVGKRSEGRFLREKD